MGHPLNGWWTMDDVPSEIRHGHDVKQPSRFRDRLVKAA